MNLNNKYILTSTYSDLEEDEAAKKLMGKRKTPPPQSPTETLLDI